MATRVSGFERVANDRYETPPWVTAALCERFSPKDKRVWEPAAGSGLMVRELEKYAKTVVGSDITPSPNGGIFVHDFLGGADPFADIAADADWICTNPPYGSQGRTAVAFCERALQLMNDLVAMLLPVDFDSAKGRRHLFANNPSFAAKMVLLERIKWFEGPSSPSANHAWYIWQRHRAGGPAALLYVTP